MAFFKSSGLCCVENIEVVFNESKMHAPIEATFSWERITIQGPIMIKPAALDLSNIPTKDNAIDEEASRKIAIDLASSKYSKLSTIDCSDSQWDMINKFAIDIWRGLVPSLPKVNALVPNHQNSRPKRFALGKTLMVVCLLKILESYKKPLIWCRN